MATTVRKRVLKYTSADGANASLSRPRSITLILNQSPSGLLCYSVSYTSPLIPHHTSSTIPDGFGEPLPKRGRPGILLRSCPKLSPSRFRTHQGTPVPKKCHDTIACDEGKSTPHQVVPCRLPVHSTAASSGYQEGSIVVQCISFPDCRAARY